ncbi:hypothetical protein I350_06550 [Cryptococcus amylolentus CBS 6273]|uniref:SH3 domain-containing protein n=1 Tax=Cryptococcus amylolentus CBS 6273 TaxID=1296118 RepID=A0A1E3JLN3_9TREE|nr:hypothetical protein I350_06550 [Cryptococcus amylolentus CBS 6273]
MSGLLDDVFGGADSGSDSDTIVDPDTDSTATAIDDAGALDTTMAERTSTTGTSSTRSGTSAAVSTSTARTSTARTSIASSSATSGRATSSVSSGRVSSSTSSSAARSSAVTSSRSSSAVSSSATSSRTSSSSSSRTSSARTSTTSSRTSSTRSRHTSTSSSETDSATSTDASSTLATTSSSSATSSATAGLGNANSGSSSSGSSLSTGAIVGIVIGCVVGVALLFLLATRFVRQKRRNDRMKRRSSMFDWPAGAEAPAESYEKPQYDPPSESFAMSEANAQNPQSVSYPTTDTYAAVPAESSTPLSYMERHNPQTSYSNSYRNSFQAVPGLAPSYPPGTQMQPGQVYPHQGAGSGYGAAAAGAGAAGVAGVGAAAAHGSPSGAPAAGAPARNVAPNSWVAVKVGFVRSLDDELAITPGQKLFLHDIYDDDWTLCEDEQHNKGAVPVSCLGPLAGGGAAPSGQALQRTASHQSTRRESLAPAAQP